MVTKRRHFTGDQKAAIPKRYLVEKVAALKKHMQYPRLRSIIICIGWEWPRRSWWSSCRTGRIGFGTGYLLAASSGIAQLAWVIISSAAA